MNSTFTILIPIYNEAENIQRLGQVLSTYLESATVSSSVLFINDGSTDESLSLLETLCNSKEHFSYISFDKNYGLSAALKAGFDWAQSTYIGYMDADMQTDPQDFNLLLKYRDDYDLVTGVRADRKDSVIKNLSSKLANAIRRSFTNDGMDDTGCPLKVMKAEYAKRIPMFKGLHRFLPAMILLQNGSVKQVPVKHFPRVAGKAKFGLRNRIFGPLVDCFAYLWMRKKYINYTISKHG